jgi:hypothetical protein
LPGAEEREELADGGAIDAIGVCRHNREVADGSLTRPEAARRLPKGAVIIHGECVPTGAAVRDSLSEREESGVIVGEDGDVAVNVNRDTEAINGCAGIAIHEETLSRGGVRRSGER